MLLSRSWSVSSTASVVIALVETCLPDRGQWPDPCRLVLVVALWILFIQHILAVTFMGVGLGAARAQAEFSGTRVMNKRGTRIWTHGSSDPSDWHNVGRTRMNSPVIFHQDLASGLVQNRCF